MQKKSSEPLVSTFHNTYAAVINDSHVYTMMNWWWWVFLQSFKTMFLCYTPKNTISAVQMATVTHYWAFLIQECFPLAILISCHGQDVHWIIESGPDEAPSD